MPVKGIRQLPKEGISALTATHQNESAATKPDEYDGQINPIGVVLQYPTEIEEVEMCEWFILSFLEAFLVNNNIHVDVAFTTQMMNPKPAAKENFKFQKIFGEADFTAAGQLLIPPGGKKPTKRTNDNAFVRIGGDVMKNCILTCVSDLLPNRGNRQLSSAPNEFSTSEGGMAVIL